MDTQTRAKFATGQLFIVATPIGNLQDITFRAVEMLKSVALIAAEDTRTSHRLLQHYGIETPMLACHEHNEASATRRIEQALNEGHDVALISDAGTPLINDPGFHLVHSLRAKGHRITPIPGACSLVTALSAAGFSCDHFSYLVFFPRRGSARNEALQWLADSPHTTVFLESPKRVIKTLQALAPVINDRPICIARELTKIHEEFLQGSATELLAHFASRTPRGEIVLIIDRQSSMKGEAIDDATILALANESPHTNLRPGAKARSIAKMLGINRNHVYKLLINTPEQ